MKESKKLRQRTFKTALALTMAAGTLVTSVSAEEVKEKSFSDVQPSHHFYEAVKSLSARGIITGYEDGTFRPYEGITRAHAAKILATALNLDLKNVKDPGFTDVSTSHPYYAHIAALVEAGVIKGYSDKSFKPNGNLTRAHIAQMLVKGFKLEEKKVANLPFTDVNDQQDFSKYIHTLYANKITSGKSATTYEPYSIVTRGQLASFAYRTEAVIKAPVTPPSTGGGNTNPPPKPDDKNFDLSIMHFNDTHAHLDNAAKRVTAINEVRATKPNSLLLDAGDVFSGTLYFNEFKGQADLKLMNLMKVDAMTFGNHEFDLGSSPEGHKALADFIKGANFPFVSANVDFSKDNLFTGMFNTKISTAPNKGNIYSGIVKEVNGEKVGIFGLTTAETKDISSPGKITFSNYIEDAKKMVAEFEKMGVNKIVALTHIGYDDNPAVDNDRELAKAVKGIDVIVGGHSHTQLDKPVVVSQYAEPTIIVQAYQYADFLGTLDVTFDKNGKVVGHAGKLIKVADKAEDPEAAEILKTYSDKVKAIKTEPTGATAVKALENPRMGEILTNPSVRKNETPLGNVITDGMLSKAREYNKDVIMAFQNGGGIRAAINEGPITVGEVIEVLPFGNTLATMSLYGSEIKEAFETSLKELPRENGGFLHVSGAQVKYDSSKPAGERVVSIAYQNADKTFTPIKDDEMYTIATNAFTAKGGDGFGVLAKAYADGRVTDLGLTDWENFRDHLKSLGNVDPKVEGRIVDVAGDGPGTELPGGTIEEDDFSGTPEAVKVYNGDVEVTVADLSKLENAVVKGDLTIKGKINSLSLSNITVEGDLDLSELDANVRLNKVKVSGNTNL